MKREAVSVCFRCRAVDPAPDHECRKATAASEPQDPLATALREISDRLGRIEALLESRKARKRPHAKKLHHRGLTIGDETKTIKAWCAHFGIKSRTFEERVRNGWDRYLALTTPTGAPRP